MRFIFSTTCRSARIGSVSIERLNRTGSDYYEMSDPALREAVIMERTMAEPCFLIDPHAD